MATRLTEKIYVTGGYLDSNMTVSSIDELKSKFDFIGQSVHMSEAFVGINDIPYPLDFWSIPNGDDVKWVVKTIPAIESEDDFEKFKDFISDFNNSIGYYPISEGSEILVNGTKYSFNVKNESGSTTVIWSNNQTVFDETISDAVDLAVSNAIDNITSGASEAFDTLKEIEDWIKQNGGNIGPGDNQDLAPLYASAHTHNNKDVLDIITIEKINEWDSIEDKIPSLEGYATETFVKNAIADAQLSGDTEIDLSGYATKDDIKNLASKDDIKIYSSGTGISVVDNKINILIETSDTENRNYIKVNEDNSLSVENIGLDDAITTEEIQVNGGAWAEDIKDIYGDKIPIGTSFQDFLKAMSCKEYFVSDISVSSSFTVTCGDLKAVLSGANSGDIVEVGTEVILKTINGTETKARQSITLSGFEYGYKLGENGAYINSKTYTENPTAIISGETGNKSLRVSFTKFASAINGGAISVKTGQNSIEQTTMYVQEGQNSVHISQTGDTYSSNTNLTAGTIYAATNLKNYYKSDKLTPNTYVPTFPLMTKTATISNTYSITGARKYYIGDIKDYSTDYWNTDKSSIVLGLEKQDWATGNTITVPYTFKIGTKQQTVVVPAVYTNVSGKDANNGAVDFSLVKTITLTNSKGNNSQYNVFVAPAYDGLTTESLINITIKKS